MPYIECLSTVVNTLMSSPVCVRFESFRCVGHSISCCCPLLLLLWSTVVTAVVHCCYCCGPLLLLLWSTVIAAAVHCYHCCCPLLPLLLSVVVFKRPTVSVAVATVANPLCVVDLDIVHLVCCCCFYCCC